MRLKIIIVLVGIIVLGSCEKKEILKNELISLEVNNSLTRNIQKDTNNEDELIKRIEVAKIIGAVFSKTEEWEDLQRTVTFQDVDYKVEDSDYITIVSNKQLMVGDGINFRPEDVLTTKEAVYLLDNINKESSYNIYIDEDNEKNPIARDLWIELFFKTIEDLEGEKNKKIQRQEIIVLATNSENKAIDSDYILSVEGIKRVGIINMSTYIDKKIEVLTKDNEIIGVVGVRDNTPTIKNVYVISSDDSSINIFVSGVERKYKIYNGTSENFAGKIASITVNQGVCNHLTVFTDIHMDTVKSYTNDKIELEKKGEIEIGEDYRVYYAKGVDIEHKQFNDLILGYDDIKHFMAEDRIISSVVVGDLKPKKIRVNIGTTGFENLLHNEIVLRSQGGLKVKYGTKEEIYNKEESFIINSENKNKYLEEGIRIYVEPVEAKEKIEISSIKRKYSNKKSPSYRGKIEIGFKDEGMTIVNELKIDEYLYSVLPSEMPMSFEIEALKAQSITARSYAYNQIFKNRFKEYGGSLDDSVQSQVYNNTEEQKLAKEVVDKTENKFLIGNGEIVSANFYSTSSGNTANSGDVWFNSVTKKFPTSTSAHLKYKKVYEGEDYGNLKYEENFKRYIKDTEITSYDSGQSWFRWSVEFTRDELEKSINKNIDKRIQVNPNMFKIESSKEDIDVTKVKNLKNIYVNDRGDGGIVRSIVIEDEEKTVEVKGEYNIRMILSPSKSNTEDDDILLMRKNNNNLKNYKLLPSGFFMIEVAKSNDNNLEKIKFIGGGNGHGVGMSQNGANAMAKEGATYEEILKYYYNGVEIEVRM